MVFKVFTEHRMLQIFEKIDTWMAWQKLTRIAPQFFLTFIPPR